jgi:CheY-like chemotaxis protein
LRASLAGLMSELKYHAAVKNLNLVHRISQQTPDSLLGDLARLRQVLTNLISNAIKFTESGQVTLHIELDGPVMQQTNESCCLNFSISDTGIGIPASKLTDIFEPFVQADGSITREYGGTGLGLAICKQLVTMMGGRIHVTSEPGLGSTFSFTARFGLAWDAAETDSSTPGVDRSENTTISEPSRKNAHSLRVLVAEDNAVNRLVVTRVVESYGHTVTPAVNGLEALKALERSHFDIVLMDVQMPFMDGLSATVAIRKIETEKGRPHLPIIGLTAHALPAERARCAELGMDGFLTKPFKSNELMALIEKLTSEYAGH